MSWDPPQAPPNQPACCVLRAAGTRCWVTRWCSSGRQRRPPSSASARPRVRLATRISTATTLGPARPARTETGASVRDRSGRGAAAATHRRSDSTPLTPLGPGRADLGVVGASTHGANLTATCAGANPPAVTATDVVFGDVYVTSGQSNMVGASAAYCASTVCFCAWILPLPIVLSRSSSSSPSRL